MFCKRLAVLIGEEWIQLMLPRREKSRGCAMRGSLYGVRLRQLRSSGVGEKCQQESIEDENKFFWRFAADIWSLFYRRG